MPFALEEVFGSFLFATPDSTLETDPGLFQGIGLHIYNLTQGNVDTAFFYP